MSTSLNGLVIHEKAAGAKKKKGEMKRGRKTNSGFFYRSDLSDFIGGSQERV